MRHPVGDAEGAEFGEMAVVERQNKMRAVRQRLNGMAIAFGKYQTSPGPKSATSHLPSIEDGDARMAFQHKRPFGGDGVPVQLTHAARFQRHVDACHTFGDRKLLDGGLARPAAGQTAFLAVGEFVLIEMLRISRRLIAAGGTILRWSSAAAFLATPPIMPAAAALTAETFNISRRDSIAFSQYKTVRPQRQATGKARAPLK